MQIDLNQYSSKEPLQADLCIVGGGAAGLTIANQFRGSKYRVLVLEGGDAQMNPESQKLYEGMTDGNILPRSEFYLTTMRMRMLGGSTNHWSGWCKPLEEIEFADRPWVYQSQWPITLNDLRPYYRRAAKVLKVADPFPDEGQIEQCEPLFPNKDAWFSSVHYGVSPLTVQNPDPKQRFRQTYAPPLADDPSVTVVVNASVGSFRPTANLRSVKSAEVLSSQGKKFEVRARYFILACGGIENARVLLLSDQVQRGGLGNENDLVGRHFMEHPHFLGQLQLQFSGPFPGITKYQKYLDEQRRKHVFILQLTPEAQREKQLLGFSAELQWVPPGQVRTEFSKELGQVTRALRHSRGREAPEVPTTYQLYLRIEQEPNPESRIQLTHETDRLGLRKLTLHWNATAYDRSSLLTTTELLAREFGRSMLGHANIKLQDLNEASGAHGGGHHLGTTRMHDDPKRGVVDRNCKLHGVDNLYVVGGSVFTSGGYTSPTMSIVTLALRLADHMNERLTV